jgi:hypothetical protein
MINKIVLLIIIVLISACNRDFDNNDREGNQRAMVRYFQRDADYEIDVNVGKGSFIGKLVDFEMGAWTSLVFQAGNGKKYSLAYCTEKPRSDLNGEKVNVHFESMHLLDSVMASLEAGSNEYKGKSFYVQWQKFIYQDGLLPGVNSPVIIDFKAPMIDSKFLTESPNSLSTGVYLYSCAGSSFSDGYYSEYYLQFFKDNTFTAKWEECEVGGLIEGTYKKNDHLIFLKSEFRTDTFISRNNRLYPQAKNNFLNCVLCESGGYYQLLLENGHENTTSNSNAQNERKVRYLYYSNGGFVAYFNDGTSIGCPRCDYQFMDPNDLKADENSSTYIVEADGSLLVDGKTLIVPKNNADDIGEGWAIIDYVETGK